MKPNYSKKSLELYIRQFTIIFLISLTIGCVLRFWVFAVYRVVDETMLPNLQRGDIVIGWKWPERILTLLFSGGDKNTPYVNRGDLVTIKDQKDDDQYIVRRVVALPGDEIRLIQKRLFINGKPFQYKLQSTGKNLSGESYRVYEESNGFDRKRLVAIPLLVTPNVGPIIVPPEHLWVLSDWRDQSNDSCKFNSLPLKNLESRLLWRLGTLVWSKKGFTWKWRKTF